MRVIADNTTHPRAFGQPPVDEMHVVAWCGAALHAVTCVSTAAGGRNARRCVQSGGTVRSHVRLGGQAQRKRTSLRAVGQYTTHPRAFGSPPVDEMHVVACSQAALYAATCVWVARRSGNARRCVQSGNTPRTHVRLGGQAKRKCTPLRAMADNKLYSSTDSRSSGIHRFPEKYGLPSAA